MTVRILAIYLLAINLITFCVYGRDKRAVVRDKDRTSNRMLLGLAAAGGSAGALAGIYVFHHKTRKRYYTALVPLMLVLQIAIVVFGMSAYAAASASGRIAGTDGGNGIGEACIEECREIDPECILVLGCAVWADNEPSPMLKDRLDTAIALYKAGTAPKLLLSGDNSRPEYSEPDCMLAYALKQGIPKEDIFLDYAGFSTYDSVYRAKAIFQAERLVVVTQKYHLFRALKLCEARGIEARGVASNQRKYRGRFMREAREVLARDKDLIKAELSLKPTYLGEEIPITGDGSATQFN